MGNRGSRRNSNASNQGDYGVAPAAASGRRSSFDRLRAALISPDRDRAIWGDPSLSHNIAEYDALRHQPPNVTMMLRPRSHPGVLGWAGFWAGNWMVFTWLANWYGYTNSIRNFWPMILVFGGLFQLAAALKALKTRDNWSSVFHGTWGSFYFGLGLYGVALDLGYAYIEGGAVSNVGGDRYGTNDTLALSLIPFFAITVLLLIPALARDMVVVFITLFQAVGTFFVWLGWLLASVTLVELGSYFGIVAAAFALYRVAAYVMEDTYHRSVLPVFRTPFELKKSLMRVPIGEPGIARGQL